MNFEDASICLASRAARDIDGAFVKKKINYHTKRHLQFQVFDAKN